MYVHGAQPVLVSGVDPKGPADVRRGNGGEGERRGGEGRGGGWGRGGEEGGGGEGAMRMRQKGRWG